MRVRHVVIVSALALGVCTTAAYARELSFEQRLGAQEAIERAYYAHQIGATKSFEEQVPRDVLEAKVAKYLQQSVALDEHWQRPVTAELLAAELEAMASRTRMPERLRVLYRALGDDPFLIQECLVRPVVVDRLAREAFASDEQIHAEARRQAEELHADLAAGRIDPQAKHPARFVVELSTMSPQLEGVGTVAPLERERGRFVTRIVLDRTPSTARVAVYSIEKRTWDDWWMEARSAFVRSSLPVLASPDVDLPEPSGAECLPDDTWAPAGPYTPPPVEHHTAIWTGSRMIAQGGSYDPTTDHWTQISTVNFPSLGLKHSAVWTGHHMILWGGFGSASGGKYDPQADVWSPISNVGAPAVRGEHTAVWSGSRMIAWGGRTSPTGSVLSTGGVYDPVTDSWAPTATTGAPSARPAHTAIWTGSRMIIWGGAFPHIAFNTGGSYDPTTNSWTPISTVGAPSARGGHTAIWTGSRMIVWGGYAQSTFFDTGAIYRPDTDSWTPTSTTGAPSARAFHTVVWAGKRMLVWGGGSASSDTNTGSAYELSTNTWTPIPTVGAPSARARHTAIWTGSRMVVWGGTSGPTSGHPVGGGGRYDPTTKTWASMDTSYEWSGPYPREYQTDVWTGNLFIVWGGGVNGGFPSYNSGARYDPVTDSWTPTSGFGAPIPRLYHVAVWTGSRMVIWGGLNEHQCECALGDGGRYDPIADTWQPMAGFSPWVGSTAVWTGSVMLVWPPGGKYDPETNLWLPMSNAGDPLETGGHTAVWTGTEMIVWGGSYVGTVNTGGRYDPVRDVWSPTSTVGAPSARAGHTAVWTGSRMIIWGDSEDNSGGRYDPSTDTWTATSMGPDAPTARDSHTAVWTGSEMIVWGGAASGSSAYLDTGGRYDALSDDWVPTSTTSAPLARAGHSAAWTGSLMLIWGGYGSGGYLRDGGRYALGHGADDDGDGLSECRGDCDDADEANYPNAVEVNDGQDNQCPGDDGQGLTDEVSGLLFSDPQDPDVFCWGAQPAAASYQIARSSARTLQTGCTLTVSPGPCSSDAAAPTAGEVFHYLVRALTPHAGSWGNALGGVCP